MHHPCHSATSACTLVATDRHLLHGRWRLAHHLLSSLRNRLCSLHLLGVIVPPPSCPLRFVRAPTSFQLVSRQPLWRRTARRLESRAALGASDLRCTPSDQNLTRVLIASVGHDCAFDRCELMLPFSMVADALPPIKASAYKIPLDMNHTPPPLASLFEDLVAKQSDVGAMSAGGGAALSLCYQCGLDATALLSKNSGRLRVQSSSFEGLWLLADELVRRLTALHTHRAQQVDSEEPLTILYAEPLPLQVCFRTSASHVVRQSLAPRLGHE